MSPLVTPQEVDMVLNPAGRDTQTSFSSLPEDVQNFYLQEAENRVLGSLPQKYADMLVAVTNVLVERDKDWYVHPYLTGGVAKFWAYEALVGDELDQWVQGRPIELTVWPPSGSEIPDTVDFLIANVKFGPQGPTNPPLTLKAYIIEAVILNLMKTFSGWRAAVSVEEWEVRRKALENALTDIRHEIIAIPEFDAIPRVNVKPRRAGQVRTIKVKIL